MRWCVVAGLLVGCAGPVVSNVKITPPDPAPAPVVTAERPGGEPPVESDGDEDGVAGGADRCPEAPETTNQYDDEDGCPDERPPAYLRGDAIAFTGPLRFAPGGALESDAGPVLDAIAALLKKHPEIGLVEIAAHLRRAAHDDSKQATRRHATTVVDALAERGVEKKRLRAAGYGTNCREKAPADAGEVWLELAVVEKSGAATGATLGCSP